MLGLLILIIATLHREPVEMRKVSFTAREIEILRLLLQTGDSNKVIARKLSLTEGTVKVHLRTIHRKLNVRSRLQAAMWAAKNLNVTPHVNNVVYFVRPSAQQDDIILTHEEECTL